MVKTLGDRNGINPLSFISIEKARNGPGRNDNDKFLSF